jgi:3-hydroxyisobutyrate dehydrogenase-like beta-hydroxyacid dehydrogenase
MDTSVAVEGPVRVACIGLGNIGGGVAANLSRAGHQVFVADLDAGRVDAAVAAGAIDAGSAEEAVRGAAVVFTSLPGPKHISAVGLGSDATAGIIAEMDPGSIWVELSTNDLDTARSLASAAAARGIAYVDAPVSGGPEGAAAGTLSIFVGGDSDHVDTVRPLLDVIGSRVTHVGPLGAGIAAKIAQVTLCYTQTVTLIEALLLGVKAGVEPATMLDLIQHSAGSSYVATNYGPEILAGTYDASFPIGHAAKDMRLASELASTVGADVPTMIDIAALYAEAEAVFGPTAPHLLAAQLRERANNMILSDLITKANT